VVPACSTSATEVWADGASCVPYRSWKSAGKFGDLRLSTTNRSLLGGGHGIIGWVTYNVMHEGGPLDGRHSLWPPELSEVGKVSIVPSEDHGPDHYYVLTARIDVQDQGEYQVAVYAGGDEPDETAIAALL
jgi:hypothetical protein